MGAFVTKNIRQGVLSIQKGAWYDPEDVGLETHDAMQGM